METNIQEIWKDIPEWEGLYQVSNLGRIKSLARIVPREYHSHTVVFERIIRLVPDKNGYLRFLLRKPGVMKNVIVHRMVMYAFVGVSSLPVDHINGIKTDNRPENLRYCTARQNNTYHSIKTNPITGASFLRGKWQSKIGHNKKQVYLGVFKSDVEAGLVYQVALKNIELHDHPMPFGRQQLLKESLGLDTLF